ncbi:glycosyltransferase family 4 protein [Paenibacillus lignilyticus]|uniref:Glycosyltransferase family 4 protein n=1 Tax=Paenibacillus lignilyticus TaxID=1172615 RepID=A0ABS5C8S6_9BACL|nr:glycosyltransferase family 4 protein [Paenibacillus lignilyticus]MBP3962401.1 glycosyltransferase family 4 protein [Paenibacillus lignilyticus]
MNLLLSAYACRPNMGSEPAVGWNWVEELSKYHDLWVLTNYTNQRDIESYKASHPEALKNVTFIYVRVNRAFWYKEWKRFERMYYYLWQKKALHAARKLTQEINFDFVQHVTYVSCILPSFMYKLGIPFIYGPISGGENIPKIIQYPMSMKSKLIETVRSLTQLIPVVAPSVQKAFKHAKLIIAVTEETKALIPSEYRSKVKVVQAIGLKSEFFEPEPPAKQNTVCKILCAGRMLYWKGFELAVQAAIQALDHGARIELTVLGDGNEEHINKLRTMSGKYLDQEIKFVRRVEYDQMKSFYDQFDILLNCSLRDSGCLVVIEGMSRGLPVICVDTGGPRVNTNSSCALKIAPAPYLQLVDQLEQAIHQLVNDEELRTSLAKAAYLHSKTAFGNERKIQELLEYYTLPSVDAM